MQATLDLLNECFKAFGAFVEYFYSDQGRKVFSLIPLNQNLVEQNITASEKYFASIRKFPELLRQIRAVVQKNLE